MGTLYLVATPLGNLEDLSPRAVRVLRNVSLIAAEDTRHTGKLLRHFGITTPVISYHAFNERARRKRLLRALQDGDVALVSDAGTPGISDPGRDLVEAAAAAGFSVTVIPGPSAVTAAAAVSGLVEGPFVFLGFLPRAATQRRRLILRADATGFPLVLFEAPTRTASTLRELAELLGHRRAVVARELTKLHEEIRRGTLDALAQDLAAQEVRGEVAIVVESRPEEQASEESPEDLALRLLRTGMKPSQAAKEMAAILGIARSAAYQIVRQAQTHIHHSPTSLVREDYPPEG
ncbi:MAG: 16S rRNA (cytidine(1402)-2'-O)-methyltransferase [Chloroflexota bacterium]